MKDLLAGHEVERPDSQVPERGVDAPAVDGRRGVAAVVRGGVPDAAAGLFVDPDPGPVLANFGMDNLRFMQPVYFGDELTVTLTCKQKTARETEDYGEVRWDTTVTNQDGQVVAQYDVLTMVAMQAAETGKTNS